MANTGSLDGYKVVAAIKTDTTKTGDNGYTIFTNETECSIQTTVAMTEYLFKRNKGNTSNKPGAKSATLSIELAHDVDDAAFEYCADHQGELVEYQILVLDEAASNAPTNANKPDIYTVKIEANGYLSDLNEGFASGVATESMTIVPGGKFKRNPGVGRTRVLSAS